MHFVDFGNTEEISLRSIVFLSRDILSLVPFAQLYCLDGVTATNSELFDKVYTHTCMLSQACMSISYNCFNVKKGTLL